MDEHVGTGPGPITNDGCAVEFYALLPAFGEPEIVHAAVPPGASILELGCGTGRILRPLAAPSRLIARGRMSPRDRRDHARRPTRRHCKTTTMRSAPALTTRPPAAVAVNGMTVHCEITTVKLQAPPVSWRSESGSPPERWNRYSATARVGLSG